MRGWLAAGILACLTGCGYVGQVQPPTLDIPQKVIDLRAAEEGSQITAEFSIAEKTTENLPLKSVRSVEVFAGSTDNAGDADRWAGSATRYEVAAKGPGALTQQIPAAAWVGKSVVLRVRATGPKGKRSAWSEPVVLEVIAPLAQPSSVATESRKDGVRITWRATAPHFRIFRAAGDAPPQQLGESDKPEYLDDSAQFGMSYQYYVMALAAETQRSQVSEPSQTITPVDKFPPEVPAGLAATAAGKTIELAWQGNTEPDFRGYNVYRSVAGGAFEKITPMPIESPVFSDTKIQAGKMYRYELTAVDLAGNESDKSAPQAASLP
ncbi:MAG TPA: hypothetical protein VGN17_30145 [Bryobacteraceae bacterium]|jgi:hypothetical protein